MLHGGRHGGRGHLSTHHGKGSLALELDGKGSDGNNKAGTDDPGVPRSSEGDNLGMLPQPRSPLLLLAKALVQFFS